MRFPPYSLQPLCIVNTYVRKDLLLVGSGENQLAGWALGCILAADIQHKLEVHDMMTESMESNSHPIGDCIIRLTAGQSCSSVCRNVGLELNEVSNNHFCSDLLFISFRSDVLDYHSDPGCTAWEDSMC